MKRLLLALFACSLALFGLSVGVQAFPDDDEFQPLFNGQDLAGWEVIGGQEDSWQVDGDIVKTTGKGGGWLSTAKEYANFHLKLEFRLPEDGNSGVFIRCPHEGQPHLDGMEIQVLDDYAKIHENLKPYQYCGSLYGVVPAMPRVSKKAKEWQSMEILCDGVKVQVTLNGTTVVDAKLDEHQDLYKEHPGLTRQAGFIGLQNHGSTLEYRNVQIRVLP